MGLKEKHLRIIEIDKADDVFERALATLYKWKEKQGQEATYTRLALALDDSLVQRRDLVEEYCCDVFPSKLGIESRCSVNFNSLPPQTFFWLVAAIRPPPPPPKEGARDETLTTSAWEARIAVVSSSCKLPRERTSSLSGVGDLRRRLKVSLGRVFYLMGQRVTKVFFNAFIIIMNDTDNFTLFPLNV